MSIQSYLKDISFDDRVRSAGQALPALVKTGKAMEFQVNIMVTKGFDKTSSKSSTFTIVAENGTIEGLIQAGSIMASNIAKLSKGVISAFYAKLGKYRDDEIPQDVPTGDNSYSVTTMTNNEMDAYSKRICSSSEVTYPAKTVTSNIYIPWVRDDVSDADISATLEQFSETIDGVDYKLGYVRFNDDNKVNMTCYPVSEVKYTGIKRSSRKTRAFLNNNDVSLGIVPDDVLSEEFNTAKSGGDDYTDTVNP